MGAETMPTSHVFHTGTALAKGLKELFKQLEERLSLRSPINVYLAGEAGHVAPESTGCAGTGPPS